MTMTPTIRVAIATIGKEKPAAVVPIKPKIGIKKPTIWGRALYLTITTYSIPRTLLEYRYEKRERPSTERGSTEFNRTNVRPSTERGSTEFRRRKMKTGKTSWEPVAAWYDEVLSGDDTYQAKVILPNLLRLMPPKGNIIDVACGQGFFSRHYADAGAKVLGIDISKSLIERARKNGGENPRFEVAPASSMPVAESNAFDGAMIVLALQNIQEIQETLAEVSRVLVDNGTLVIVLNHPCFRIPQGSSWGYDEQKNVQYRRVDHYGVPFSMKIDMTPGASPKDKKVHTVSFHRPLQEYVKALAKAGFSIVSLEEWISHKKSEKGPRAAAEDAARKEFPLFLTLAARKVR